jgi:hypothetical protein
MTGDAAHLQKVLAARTLFDELKPGDRISLLHHVKVGSSKSWTSTTTGEVVRTERRRHGLHFRRSTDDKVYSDFIVLKRDSGELTTLSIDEFSDLQRI